MSQHNLWDEPARSSDADPPALVAVYADESCLGNGREGSNPGGAGGVMELVEPESGSLARWDYWVSEPATTNNRMALRSVIEAFGQLSRMKRPETAPAGTTSEEPVPRVTQPGAKPAS